MQEQTEITKLAYELTYHTHLLNRDKSLFTELGIPEYIILHGIAQTAAEVGGTPGRVYLNALSRKLGMAMPGVSKMAARLKEQGLVQWSHDGKGDEGTFLVITDAGLRAMKRQEARLTDYYSRVAAKFGRENLKQLLQQMKALETVMDEEFVFEEETAYGSDETE